MIASLFAALAPMTISFFAGTPLTWRAALALGLFAAPALYLVYGKNRLGAQTPSTEAVPADEKPVSKGLPFTYWLYWGLVFLVEAIEFCIAFWAADYLETVTGFSKANAALGVSAFMAAMLTGRWLVSRLLRRAQEQRLVLASLSIALVGFLAFWLAPAGTPFGSVLALLGLLVTGLGIAGLYPMINSLALSSAPGRMIEASGRLSLAIGSSIFLMPLLLARLADAVGIQGAYSLELALIGAAFVLAFWARTRKA
jgi:fucose permease